MLADGLKFSLPLHVKNASVFLRKQLMYGKGMITWMKDNYID